MKRVTIKANAKINLCLNITGIKADGYHKIDSIFQSIRLFDLVTVLKHDGIIITCDDDTIPLDEKNTCYKMAKALMDRFGISGLSIDIQKNIPASAGLGGASADAAAVLVGACELFDKKVSFETMVDIAKEIGADVPFFLRGGCVWATGIGEVMVAKTNPFDYDIVLIKPFFGVSTPQAYRLFDQTCEIYTKKNTMIDALKNHDEALYLSSMRNDLQTPAFALNENCEAARQTLLDAGALKAMVTGSGSAVFGLFNDGAHAFESIDKTKFDHVFLTKKSHQALEMIK